MTKSIGLAGRALAVSLLAATSGFGSAAVAHAGTNETITVRGGQGSFQHHGEILTAFDTRRDGRCLRTYLRYTGGGPNSPALFEKVTACGRGEVARKNLRFQENQNVWIQVCYVGGGTSERCSAWQGAHA